MNEEMLQRCVGPGSAFLQYVNRFPLLAEEVNQHVAVLRLTRGSAALLDRTAARDAAQSLFLLADQRGFSDVAMVFYACYERISRTLLVYL